MKCVQHLSRIAKIKTKPKNINRERTKGKEIDTHI